MAVDPARALAVATRRHAVAEGILKGKRQAALAAEWHVTPACISIDLKKIRALWQREANLAIEKRTAQEIAVIDLVQAEAFAAWARSLEAQRTDTEETESAPVSGDNGTVSTPVKSKAGTKTVTTAGDPQWLTIILQCVEKRCRILGVDAPVRAELIIREEAQRFAEMGLDPEEILTEARLLLKAGDDA